MLADMLKLQSITGMEYLDIRKCTNFTGMLPYDPMLESLDLTYLDMNSIDSVEFKDMFTGDAKLWKITLGKNVKINTDFPPAPDTPNKIIPFPSMRIIQTDHQTG